MYEMKLIALLLLVTAMSYFCGYSLGKDLTETKVIKVGIIPSLADRCIHSLDDAPTWRRCCP